MSLLSILLCLLTASLQNEWTPSQWPVLKEYDKDHLKEIALPLGGIGTGTVSLGGRGELRDWEIMNIPAKGYSTVTPGNNAPFFAIHVQKADGDGITRMLAGNLYQDEYLHYEGRPVDNYGLPRFSEASFKAAYPFGQVLLSDPDLPVKVTVKGFNPLIPASTEDSSLPIAVLSYAVTNSSDSPLKVSVCGSIRNFIGKDGHLYDINWKGDQVYKGSDRNKNEFRTSDRLSGIYFYSEGVDPKDPAWGNMSLTTASSGKISYRTSSVKDNWNNAILNFWDDFSDDGMLTELPPSGESDPMASLSVKKEIAPGETAYFTFFLTWNFPNRKAWSQTVVGNWYSQKYPNSWETACQIVPRLPELEAGTLLFVNSFLSSTYPDEVKEAALFNLNVLRSQTVFRLPSGHMMGWEGIFDRFGSCQGSCTHVWNYETATAFLFGDLARTMRDVEFNYALKDNGLMNFRAALPLSEASKGNSPAADGQLGCIMKIYREWQLSGDMAFLQSNWEKVKLALSYAWVEKGWDGNRDGVMEGSQHNTMDVNYFGPNPQMQFWYLGALKAASAMATAMKDKAFAKECDRIFASGSAWTDANLFNGEYYEHRITDPETFAFLDENETMIPDFQLGKGCLVDQLVGQYMAHICGLGYLADKEKIRTTLRSIMKYNFVEDIHGHFNNMRSYVFDGESALLMASWPKGRLKVPFPYFAEAMTGFEYTAAVGMIYEGMTDDAFKCIKAIRDRFDGRKRNPFSEPECGHHYARSMASWSAIPALSGFHFSAVERSIGFTSVPGRFFWSNGHAWGLCTVTEKDFTLEVLKGCLDLDTISIGDRTLRRKGLKISEGGSFTALL